MPTHTWEVAVTEEVQYTVAVTSGDLHDYGHPPTNSPDELARHIRDTAVELLLAAEGDTASGGPVRFDYVTGRASTITA
jgi:hypothetical protein